jgi:hypothetical protein
MSTTTTSSKKKKEPTDAVRKWVPYEWVHGDLPGGSDLFSESDGKVCVSGRIDLFRDRDKKFERRAEFVEFLVNKLQKKSLFAFQAESVLLSDDVFTFGEKKGFLIQDSTGTGKGRQIAASILMQAKPGSRHLWMSQTETLGLVSCQEFRDVLKPPRETVAFYPSPPPKEEEELAAPPRTDIITSSTLVVMIQILRGDGWVKYLDELQRLHKELIVVFYLDYQNVKDNLPELGRKEGGKKKKTTENVEAEIDIVIELLGLSNDSVFAFDECHNLVPGKKTTDKEGKITCEATKENEASNASVFESRIRKRFPKGKYLYASATPYETFEQFIFYQDRLLDGGVDIVNSKYPHFKRNRDTKECPDSELAVLQVIPLYLVKKGKMVSRRFMDENTSRNEVVVRLDDPYHLLFYRRIVHVYSEYFKRRAATIKDTDPKKKQYLGQVLGTIRYLFAAVLTGLKSDFVLKSLTINAQFSYIVVTKYTFFGEERTSIRMFLERVKGGDGFGTLEDKLEYPECDDLIDRIWNLFPRARIAELTGRSNYRTRELEYFTEFKVPQTRRGKDGKEIVEQLGVTTTPFEQDRTKIIQQFKEEDSIDILILGEVGSTGISLHQAKKNGTKRKMLYVELGDKASEFLQYIGRVERSGQKEPPIIEYVVTEFPYEVYMKTQILAKLQNISAITTGSLNNTTGSQLFDRKEANIKQPLYQCAVGEQALQDFLEAYETMKRTNVNARLRQVVEDALKPYEEILQRQISLIGVFGDDAKSFCPPFSIVQADLVGIINRAIAAMYPTGGWEKTDVNQFFGRLALVPFEYQLVMFTAFKFYFNQNNKKKLPPTTTKIIHLTDYRFSMKGGSVRGSHNGKERTFALDEAAFTKVNNLAKYEWFIVRLDKSVHVGLEVQG